MPIPAGPDPVTYWTTPDTVLAVTGETVTEQDLAIASAMIETKAGASRDMPEDSINARDRRTLQRATCWQAAWVKSHPGLLTEYGASTDTSAAGVRDKRDSISAILYAPMAILELRNLSWFGTRSEPLPAARAAHPVVDFLNESSDGYGTWRPV